jgi:hypothetical protein
MFTVIIIGKTALFCIIRFLRRFGQIFLELDLLVFTSLDFAMIFYRGRPSALCPTPNLEGQVSVCMSLSDMVAQLNTQALSSFFITFCNWQGYSGSIVTCLHTGVI